MKRLSFLFAALLLTNFLYAQKHYTAPAPHKARHERLMLEQKVNRLVIENRQQSREEIEAIVRRAFSPNKQTAEDSLPSQHKETHQQCMKTQHPLCQPQPLPQKQTSPAKQWQIAMFLAAADRPLSETLETLHTRVRQGLIRQAVVFDVTPRQVVKGNQTSREEIYPEHFYILYQDGRETVTKDFTLESAVQTQELMNLIFKYFQKGDDLYSAVIIDGHGDGLSMSYGKESTLSPQHILSALQKNDIKLDILNLISCTMGSFYNLYYLSRYHNISYLVTASDLMTVAGDSMYYSLLNHLRETPEQAAVNTTLSAQLQLNFDDTDTTPSNAITVKLDELSYSVVDWFYYFGLLMKSGSEEFQEKMLSVFDPRFGERRSFKKILKRQLELLPRLEPAFMKDDHTDYMAHNFSESGDNLLEMLEASTLAQWCYSAQKKMLYVNKIPKNIDCSDGVSVTQEQLEKLLAEEDDFLTNALAQED